MTLLSGGSHRSRFALGVTIAATPRAQATATRKKSAMRGREIVTIAKTVLARWSAVRIGLTHWSANSFLLWSLFKSADSIYNLSWQLYNRVDSLWLWFWESTLDCVCTAMCKMIPACLNFPSSVSVLPRRRGLPPPAHLPFSERLTKILPTWQEWFYTTL